MARILMARFWRHPLPFAAAAAFAAVLFDPGVASATGTVPLHSAHRGATASAFASNECATTAAVGSDRWVFVLPRNDANFVTLTLSFTSAGGTVTTVRIPDSGDPYPDGIDDNGASKAWVVLPSGWTLRDGSATVDADTRAPFFNLTHTCVGSGTGGESPSPTPKPSKSHPRSPSASPTPSTSPSSSPPASVPGSPSVPATTPVPANTGGSLPTTGTAIGWFLLIGLGAIGAGSTLLLARRRGRVRFTAE